MAAAAGCGSSADNDFILGYNTATAPLTRLTTPISRAAPATGGTRSAQRKLERMATGLEDVKTRLDALQPPDDARKQFDRMLRALDGNAAQTQMAAAVAQKDLGRLADELQQFSKVSAELRGDRARGSPAPGRLRLAPGRHAARRPAAPPVQACHLDVGAGTPWNRASTRGCPG